MSDAASQAEQPDKIKISVSRKPDQLNIKIKFCPGAQSVSVFFGHWIFRSENEWLFDFHFKIQKLKLKFKIFFFIRVKMGQTKL